VLLIIYPFMNMPQNVLVFGSKKAKGPKQDSQNQLSSPMHDGREFVCIV
jgi:hypothetical protein